MRGKAVITGISCSFLLVCIFFPGRAQDERAWIEAAEESIIREDDSQFSECELEARQELFLFPVNLNEASGEQLASSGLFSTFQVKSILAYREKYGDLFSIYELAGLDGFRKQRLVHLSSSMTVSSKVQSSPQRKSPTRILMFAGRTHSSSGEEVSYPGSLWKTSLRLKSGIGKRILTGIAYEKDQGERCLWENRPEHLSGFLELRGAGLLEKLIIGSFRINNGMGLIQGSGLMHTPEAIQSRPLRLSSIKPYAGTAENLIHQGAALRLNLGKTKLLLWSSYQNTDLSLSAMDSTTENTCWTDYIRETGLHRTSTELAGRNLAYLGSTGIQVLSNFRKLSLGLQYFTRISGLNQAGKDSLQYSYGSQFHHTTSIQWGWRLNKLIFFGEFAPGRQNSSAFLGGSHFLVNDFLSATIQFHNYGAKHQETFASAYASGSHIANERGLLLLVLAEPFRNTRADLSVEIYQYPGPRYQVPVPSSGFRYKFTLHNGSMEILQWKLRMTFTSRQVTPSSGLPGIQPLHNIGNSKIDGKLLYRPLESFTWQSRLVISYTPREFADRGHAAIQQVALHVNNTFKCTAQFVIFHIPSWNNRICLYEPGLYQQFRFPVYSGMGNKLSFAVSMKLAKRLVLEGKCSVLLKNGMENREAGIQLRMNF